MAISREKKEEVVAHIQDSLKNAVSVAFVNFHGLSVKDEQAMRRSLKERGIEYFVAKKTLVKRALHDAGFKGEQPELEGELALAVGDDPVEPARSIHEAGKAYEGLAITGGIFEGAYQDATQMQIIATIPPLQTLYGQFANVINSPIQGLVIALNEVAKKRES